MNFFYLYFILESDQETNPFRALHLLHVFSSGVWCSLDRGLVERLLHFLSTASPVGCEVLMLRLGRRNPFLLSQRRASCAAWPGSLVGMAKPGQFRYYSEEWHQDTYDSSFGVRSEDTGLYLANAASRPFCRFGQRTGGFICFGMVWQRISCFHSAKAVLSIARVWH